MTFDEVLEKVPQLKDYLINMPKELKINLLSKFILLELSSTTKIPT